MVIKYDIWDKNKKKDKKKKRKKERKERDFFKKSNSLSE